MKKVGLIAVVTCALSSCGSGNYIPCPAYGSNEYIPNGYHETEGQDQDKGYLVLSAHGQENDYYFELAMDLERENCENCDEID